MLRELDLIERFVRHRLGSLGYDKRPFVPKQLWRGVAANITSSDTLRSSRFFGAMKRLFKGFANKAGIGDTSCRRTPLHCLQ